MAAGYLFLVRHGETEANEKDIEAGPRGYSLTEKGRKNVKFVAKALSDVKVRAVYSSPIFRAVETAEILAKPHHLTVKILEELTEAKIRPEFVGKKGRQHILESPGAYLETYKELRARTSDAIETIGRESSGDVIAVSHGDVISAILETVVERRITSQNFYVMHPEPASLCVIDLKSRPFLVLYNYHRKMLAEV